MNQKLLDIVSLFKENKYSLYLREYWETTYSNSLNSEIDEFKITSSTGINEEMIKKVEENYSISFQDSYKSLLRFSNGIKLFISQETGSEFVFYSLSEINRINSEIQEEYDENEIVYKFRDLAEEPKIEELKKTVIFGEFTRNDSYCAFSKEDNAIYEIDSNFIEIDKIYSNFQDFIDNLIDSLGQSAFWLDVERVHTIKHGSRRISKQNTIPEWFQQKYSYLIESDDK